MKKTIVIIILAVYVAAIAVVNFFGLEIKMFDSITYVTSIQCDTVTFHGDNSKQLTPSQYVGTDGNTPLFIFDFIPADADSPYTSDIESVTNNPNRIAVDYEVMPHLADESGVKFEYDEAAGVAVFHELSTSFIFLQPNKMFTVTIRATDGSNVSYEICIMGRIADASAK